MRFEARRPQAPLGQEAPLPAVTIADLLRATLRHRPDRILVGEVRGAEAFDLLQALNTGHQGALSTIHANSAEQALARLAHCVLTANVGLPHRRIRDLLSYLTTSSLPISSFTAPAKPSPGDPPGRAHRPCGAEPDGHRGIVRLRLRPRVRSLPARTVVAGQCSRNGGAHA